MVEGEWDVTKGMFKKLIQACIQAIKRRKEVEKEEQEAGMTDEQALSRINALIEADPGRDKNYHRRGLIYVGRKQWKEAAMLQHGADPNLANPAIPEFPPLMLAVGFGAVQLEEGLHVRWSQKELIEALLTSGADPNFTNGQSDTPLLVAADKGLRNPGELLLLYGAKMPSKDNKPEEPPEKTDDEKDRDYWILRSKVCP